MLNVPVYPATSVWQVPVLWIERALAAHRAESDAAAFRTQQQIAGLVN